MGYKTSEEASAYQSEQLPPDKMKKELDRKAKLMNSNMVGSPRKTSSKTNDNVVSNPQFDAKKMDPLMKSGHRPQPSQRKPPNAEVANSNTSRSDSMESSSAPLRPHTGGDVRWEAINIVNSKGSIGLSNFRLLKRLGYGDIGSVYLVELRGTTAYFAMKVMDKASLASRNKLLRAQTEREILGLLDHPFLPTLYSYFETDKFYCLVMEFCSGGNLHSLRQKQQNKYFTEDAARSVFSSFFFCLLLIMLVVL